MIELTVTSYAGVAFFDEMGLDARAPDAQFWGAGLNPSETRTYRMTSSAWDRVRPVLRALETRRVPAFDESGARIAGATMSALTWSVTTTPARNPRIHQIEETSILSVVTDGLLTLRGESLLNGTKAQFDVVRQSAAEIPGASTGARRFNSYQKVLRLTAVDVGPIGNLIKVRIKPASGAGDVTITMHDDGEVRITVTPAAAGTTATDVAAQINGSAAATYVTATALVGSAVVPPTDVPLSGEQRAPQVATSLFKSLIDGDGGGIARYDILVSGTDPTNRLRLMALKGGNAGNRIAIVLLMSQGANAVAVSNNVITVSRTGATETLANLASAINGNASAAALVTATAVGSGSLGALTRRYLYGGAGPDFSATVGGAAATILSHTDTVLTMSVTAAALVAAGVVEFEQAVLQLIAGTLVLEAPLRAGIFPAGYGAVRARVRAQSSVTIATPGATIDGVTMAAGNRFWSDVQSTTTQDGLYVWNGAATPATRAPEVPAGARVSGLLVSISEGTDAGIVRQVSNAPGSDVVGTANLATAAI